MWWLIGGYAAFSVLIGGYAAHVALSATDKEHRADAYRVLKLVWGTGTGRGILGGLIAVIIKLHQNGLW